MDKCLLISCLVLAQIRHNGKNYQVGDVVCLSANDKLFLEKAKYVRVATPDEVAEFEQKQAGADNPPNANLNSHLDNGESVGNDSEPTLPVSEPTQTEPIANEPQPSEAVPPAEPVSVPEPVPALAYDKLTKAELIAQLTTRGINHNPKAKNDELVALLVADDAKASEPVPAFDEMIAE